MSALQKLPQSLSSSFAQRCGFRNKKTATLNLQQDIYASVFKSHQVEFDALLNRLAEDLKKVNDQNIGSLIEPVAAKRVKRVENDDDDLESIPEEEEDETPTPEQQVLLDKLNKLEEKRLKAKKRSTSKA